MDKKSTSGIKIITLILIGIFIAFFAPAYGFGIGGGEMRIGHESSIEIDGNGNSAISIAGNDNHATQQQIPQSRPNFYCVAIVFILILLSPLILLKSYGSKIE